jgi:beta-glucosidase
LFLEFLLLYFPHLLGYLPRNKKKEAKNMKKISKARSIPALVLIAVLVIALIVGNCYAVKYAPIITTYLGQTSYEVQESGDSNEDTEYFKSLFSSELERLTADKSAATVAAAEGFVLLKNDNDALPMTDAGKVTLFGVNSADILYGGGGSGAVDTSTAPTLKSALEESGFEVNPTMWDFYTTGAAKDIRMDVADIAGTGRYVIHEASPDLFSATETGSFADYSDAAIVTFSRSGSESADVPVVYDESYAEVMDIEGYMGAFHSEPVDSPDDIGRNYLELTATEEALLEYVSSQFDKVIVLINAGNAMELSFLDQEQYGVDACLWIGNPGQDGLYAVGDILTGVANPSGRTVDTYAYDPTNAPAVQNFGSNTMTNAEDQWFSAFVVYQEGIYVGYQYYETRYEDTVLNQGNASSAVGASNGASSWAYANEVQFPFGYGLSYTTFTQELVDSSYENNTFTFTVKVTNTGDWEGKDVVELYAQSPYTDYDRQNGVEKSAVQLVGFAKTDSLKAGESQTLTITVDEEELKSYDADGTGSYILEAGDYYFTAATDAHNAVNNILAAKGATGLDGEGSEALTAKFAVAESSLYAVSTTTGYEIQNQFADADMRTYDADFTYLTRADWEGTYPQPYQVVATDDMLAALAIPEGTDDPDAEMPTTGANNGLTLAMMMGLDADDPAWDDLMDQLTAEEMYNLVRVGGYQTQAVNSVSAPSTVCVDGPAYVGNAGTTGVTRAEATYAWCSEVVLASTWNTDILYSMGALIGQDCLAQGELNFAGWYAPAMNIHRTAFSGRNFEYYSEDGFLSGKMGAATVQGATQSGVICFVKHFALNDQETNRTTLNTFANEQSIRQLYLKPFETSITCENGSLGIMASMNRIGLTWSGDHYGLMTEVVRNEWGFGGVIITDQASYPQAFPGLAIRGGLEGGIDLWLNSGTDNWLIEGYDTNPTVMTQLRTASKHILYAVANSLAMNGISSSAKVVQVMPAWQTWMIALDVVVGVLALVGVVLLVKKTQWKKV